MKLFLRRVLSIAAKEAKHIRRDPFTLAVSLVLPLVFVGFFGFVIDLDYKHLPILVQDNDQSSYSRRLIQEASSSQYFDVTPVNSAARADRLLLQNDTKALLIIEPDYGKRLVRAEEGLPAKLQLLTDGSDNAQAAILSGYMQGLVQAAEADFLRQNPDAPGADTADLSAALRTRFLFNPELNSRWFIVPALSTIIIGFLAILLTAMTVAKEWENGSMELLLSTPATPLQIVLGKLLPYFVLTFFDVMLVFVLALLVFRIPFLGSFPLYAAACTLYITGALALGLLISVLTRQQQAAIQFGFAVGLLPSFIFSGFIFPIENMPLFFRCLTALFPQRWFLSISRSLFLSEAGFTALAGPFAAITLFAAVMILLAVKNFKTDVEP